MFFMYKLKLKTFFQAGFQLRTHRNIYIHWYILRDNIESSFIETNMDKLLTMT